MQSSEWRPVVGYEGQYEVSDQGQVRSLDHDVDCADGRRRRFKGKELKPTPNASGHLVVDLGKSGRRGLRVHRLVLEAFVGPAPDGLIACHSNDIPSDNRLENLRWDTYGNNAHDAVRNGRNVNARKTHCKRGHEFTAANTINRGSNRRGCRTCSVDYLREYHAKRKAF